MEQNQDLSLIAKEICIKEKLYYDDYVGGGAFKQVFRVKSENNQNYALKVIKGSSPRTEREIKAIQRCSHNNIAQLFRSGTYIKDIHSFDYTVEEFLPGGTLTTKLTRGNLNNEQLLNLGLSLISAISHIASHNLVHRDIKPDNIMFKADDITPILVDFGLVRDLSAESLTKTWALQGPGTPYFAPPEQLNNQKRLIDWRSDQFALGVVLCFSRFRMHPYQYPDEPLYHPQTVERVANREARNPQLLSDFQVNGLACLIKMTEPWPVQRFCRPEELTREWVAQGGS